jgi:processive 1,2-diacylglycerol beta-glucosyltransferase
MPGPYKVLILSVSAGTGHVKAAEALEAVCRSHPQVSQVVNVDALTYTNKMFRDFYSKLYIRLVKSAPKVLGWWYDAFDEPWKREDTRLMFNRLNTRPLVEMIRAFNPDVTICTHFMPAEIMSYLIRKKKIRARLSIVITDLDVHAMWLSRVFHHYFVALDESKVHLARMGVPEHRITVTGIPIDARFALRRDKKKLLQRLGLDDARPVLLVSAGALGVGNTENLVRALALLKTPMQIVVICGRNEELRESVLSEVEAVNAPHLSFLVLGYVTEMWDWMAAADLFLGKPGGLTTAECMASGLPMAILDPIPGQEERNSDHLLEWGAAIKCNQLTTVAHKIDHLFAEPARLRRMARVARQQGKPYAARRIVDALIEQVHAMPVRVLRRKAADTLPG